VRHLYDDENLFFCSYRPIDIFGVIDIGVFGEFREQFVATADPGQDRLDRPTLLNVDICFYNEFALLWLKSDQLQNPHRHVFLFHVALKGMAFEDSVFHTP